MTLRVGLIGAGYAGRTLHAPLLTSVPGLALAAIGVRDPAKVRAAWPGAAGGPAIDAANDLAVVEPAALLADPSLDLVVIATPNDSHYALARAALGAGKHVVIDKPFAVTLAQCDELVALAAQRRRLLSIFHNRRWDGDFRSLQRVMASGALGEVRVVTSRLQRFEPTPRPRWREVAGPGSGLWFDFGPHLIDQALLLFGAPRTITADLATLRDGATADDHAQVVLGYPKRRVTLVCTRLAAHPAARLEAHGLAGSFHCEGWDVQEAQLKAGLRPGAPGWGEDARPVLVTQGRGATQLQPRERGDYRCFYEGVRDAIRGEGENPVPAQEARMVMAVLECATQSAAQGRTLAFEA